MVGRPLFDKKGLSISFFQKDIILMTAPKCTLMMIIYFLFPPLNCLFDFLFKTSPLPHYFFLLLSDTHFFVGIGQFPEAVERQVKAIVVGTKAYYIFCN
jgi:hypothetical protein